MNEEKLVIPSDWRSITPDHVRKLRSSTVIDKSLGIDSNGLPKVGSIWLFSRLERGAKVDLGNIYFVRGHSGGFTHLTYISEYGRHEDSHSWQTRGIVENWSLMHVPSFEPQQRWPFGTKIVLTEDVGMAAKLGATATVRETSPDHIQKGFVNIVWDRDERAGSQMNGSYYHKLFDAVGGDVASSKKEGIAPAPRTKEIEFSGIALPLDDPFDRHERFEGIARDHEASGRIREMKLALKDAQSRVARDRARDSERRAVEQNRFVAKAAMAAMGTGDRRCFEMKGLREFEQFKSQGSAHLWWE